MSGAARHRETASTPLAMNSKSGSESADEYQCNRTPSAQIVLHCNTFAAQWCVSRAGPCGKSALRGHAASPESTR